MGSYMNKYVRYQLDTEISIRQGLGQGKPLDEGMIIFNAKGGMENFNVLSYSV